MSCLFDQVELCFLVLFRESDDLYYPTYQFEVQVLLMWLFPYEKSGSKKNNLSSLYSHGCLVECIFRKYELWRVYWLLISFNFFFNTSNPV